MRRHTSTFIFCLFCILGLANALSLANFQLISPTAVSLGCFVEYNTVISTCKLSDFNNGCSLSCQSALNSKALCVSKACSADNVASTTLLGILKNGGILAALCPNIKVSTRLTSTTTSTLVKTSTVSEGTTAESVTIPTSPGVTISSTSSSSSFQSSSSPIITTFSPLLTIAQSTSTTASRNSQFSQKSSSITFISSALSTSFMTSISPTSSESASILSSYSSSSSSASDTNTNTNTAQTTSQLQPSTSQSTSTETTAATPKATISTAAAANNGDGISGGGSPFDIDANGGGSLSGVGRVPRGLVVGIGLAYGIWFLE